MEEAKWYVVHTFSGYEKKVKEDLEKTIKNRGLQDQILKVSIPLEQEEEETEEEKSADKKKKNKNAKLSRKLFPAYVLVQMILNDDTWYIVRNARGVTGFVGPGSKPVPLTDEEMENIRSFMEASEEEIPFRTGDYIEVKEGPFAGTKGRIQTVDAENRRLTILAEVFNRETEVELGFAEAKKV